MRQQLVWLTIAVLAQPYLIAAAAAQTIEDLRNLSIEELRNVEILSASKQPPKLGTATTSIYVITHDDIIRSGALTIPQILRLAPNLFVAQFSPIQYTITARGFSGNLADQNAANKLLVLIDGRSVYSPLFAGVYWDTVDVLPEDIERIEVISGPGGALWGANAVNGVNARLGWAVTRNVEVSLDGFNLLHARHQEFMFPGSDEIKRNFFLDTRWKF